MGKDLARKFDDAPGPLLYTIKVQEMRFAFRAIQEQELRDAFGRSKATKSIGNDNVSIFTLRFALHYAENSLLRIFNTN